MADIRFTNNYTDESNIDGFQFAFRCERCGNGYRSSFQPNMAERGRGIARSLGNMFGGAIYSAANAADSLLSNRSTNSAGKDRALAKAVDEIAERFVQCRSCGDWVCREVCWNDGVGQCLRCAPLIDDEINRLRFEEQRVQTREKLQTMNMVQDVPLAQDKTVGCPSCGARTSGRFCGECGTAVRPQVTVCSCGTENPLAAKFCGECGAAIGA